MTGPGPLPPSAEVVIIGGGVIGLSCAYHLAKAGVKDVLLLERDLLGSGSSSRAAGGVRAQFSDLANVQLGARSLETFRRFPELFDQDIDYREVGYLFLLSTPESLAAFEKSVALQNEVGIASEIISVKEAKQLSPLITTDGLIAAAYCATDGHCTPDSVVHGLARGSQASGAQLHTQTVVIGIERQGSTITAVKTSRGDIRAGSVICAAGAWSQAVGAWADVHLPVAPVRRQLMVTEPIPGLDRNMPFTIDFETSFYFHESSRQMVFGMSDPDETSGFSTEISENWLPRLNAAMARAPFLSTVGVAATVAGLYEVTADHNALIGEADDVSRFIYATGFSGHGFLMSPAVGEVVRDIYLGRAPVVDVAGFDANRFSRSSERREMNVV